MTATSPHPNPADLTILKYPDPALRKRAKEVAEFTPELRAVAARMLQLMREVEGIGLAAPQVGLPWRMFILQVPESEEDDRHFTDNPPTCTKAPLIFVNPVLSDPSADREPFNEGCLSLPEIRGDVIRPTTITVAAQDENGKPFTLRAAGLLGRCIQHEYDHLEGMLIIDRFTQMSRLKTAAAVKAFEKRKR